EQAEADPELKLKLTDPKVRLPQPKSKKGPRYTPVSRRQDRPNAILWLVRNHPELKDSQIMRLVGTTKSTIESIRQRTHWEAADPAADGPVDARLVPADRPRSRSASGRQGEAGRSHDPGRYAAARLGDHHPAARARGGGGEEAAR